MTTAIASKLKRYKRKFYLNLLFRGSLIGLAIVLSVFLSLTLLEASARFGSVVRAVFLFSFVGFFIFIIYRFILVPTFAFFNITKGVSDESAATSIGRHFPAISDKLLNMLQLEAIASSNHLAKASVSQRASELDKYDFAVAVNFKDNLRFFKYVIPIAFFGLALLAIKPSLIVGSTTRIVQFNQEFTPNMPFHFNVDVSTLKGYRNEDFTVALNLTGSTIPESAFVVVGGRRIKMEAASIGAFSYTFSKIQSSKKIHFEAAGYESRNYEIEIFNRPNLKEFEVSLSFPKYLDKPLERLTNVGSFEVPEGTLVNWNFSTSDVEDFDIVIFDTVSVEQSGNQLFTFEKTVFKDIEYAVLLNNSNGSIREPISYQIQVISDEYPSIDLNIYQDTILYSYLVLGGNISDDYGISGLNLNYEIVKDGKLGKTIKRHLEINPLQNSQSYYHYWNLDSIDLSSNDQLNYWIEVFDNDGVNGIKSSKTGVYAFHLPDDSEIEAELEKSSAETTSQLDRSLEEAKELKRKLEEAENRLKGKKETDWQDEKLLQEILDAKEKLENTIKALQEQFNSENEKRDRFSQQQENITEKVEQLKQLMDELLDEETKKLYEELKRLLEEHSPAENIQDMLNKMNNKERNIEEELERALEHYKQLKVEQELAKAIEDLQELTEKQEQLAEETEQKNSDPSELLEKQKQLQEEFKEFKESMDKVEESNQELKEPDPMQDVSEEENEIEEQQKNSSEQLEQENKKESSESQKKATEQMQKLTEKMQQMQSSMESMQMEADVGDLRAIVHNLIKLSVDQEDLKKDFSQVELVDPRFVELSQQQLKLRDDSRIIKDSLMALASRVPQISSFVTRELNQMTDKMEESLVFIKDRKQAEAVSAQQFAMTSMNNLALMLDNVLDQMQQSMGAGKGKQKKRQNQPMPSMSEMQKELNQRIQELKESGKSGRDLSEELAKLAADQERIRKALQEMQEKLKNNGNPGGEEILEKMEETELDLVNKQITQQTLRRQEDILTRMLEAEKSEREQDQEEKREAKSASQYEKEIPKALEEYFKSREKEIELLRTVPPKLFPYFKKEVNNYFQRLGEAGNN